MILSSTKIFSILTKPYARKILVCQSIRLSHYQTLGINSTATPEEIKAAYFELSKKYHPDVNDNSQESIKKFQEINRAYEVLGKEHLKREYDLLLRNGGRVDYSRFSKETEEQFAQRREFFYRKRGPINMGPWFTDYENEDVNIRRSFKDVENERSKGFLSNPSHVAIFIFFVCTIFYINYRIGVFIKDYFVDPRSVSIRRALEKQSQSNPDNKNRRVFYFVKYID